MPLCTILHRILPTVLLLLLILSGDLHADIRRVQREFTSAILAESIHDIPLNRRNHVLLPEGYEDSKQRYPVIYYLRGLFANHDEFFASGDVVKAFEQAMGDKKIPPVIVVFPDFSAPPYGSFYQNDPISGRWLDYMVEEVIPEIDKNYRTLADVHSRGVTGDFFGGYASIKLAMLYPGYFNALYALHPVATGSGYIPITYRAPWEEMSRAQSFEDLQGNIFGQVFLAMAQAYLPNPDKPPFYADLVVDTRQTPDKLNPALVHKMMQSFLLENYPLEAFMNLHRLSGVMLDWARYDSNQDHVLANQRFTRLLDSRGVNHRADEYRGTEFQHHWSLDEHGRVYNTVLPFFSRHLEFKD